MLFFFTLYFAEACKKHLTVEMGWISGQIASLAALAGRLFSKALIVELATGGPASSCHFNVVARWPLTAIGAPMPNIAALQSAIGRHAEIPHQYHQHARVVLLRFMHHVASTSKIQLPVESG